MAKWAGPSGHLTWPSNPPKKTKTKTKKNNKHQKLPKSSTKKTKKNKNTPNELFNYQPFWGGGPKIHFLKTWPKKRAPPKHYKNRVSAHQFLKNRYASRNGHFWTKNKSRNSSYLFCLSSSLLTTKHKTLPKIKIKLFYSVLANIKREY